MNEDIVNRLRDSQFGGRSLCREAADEIGRLRLVVEELEITLAQRTHECQMADEAVQELQNRLRKSVVPNE